MRLSDKSLIVQDIDLEAMQDNSGTIYLANPDPIRSSFALTGSNRGYRLTTDRRFSFETIDLQDIWIDGTTDGDGVTWGAIVVVKAV